MKRIGCTLALAVALALAMRTDVRAQVDDEKMTDERMIALLHHVNQDEIKAGQLAQKKGQSAEIKNYGMRLLADHTRSEQELMEAAKKAGIKPNQSALTAQDKEMLRVERKKMDQLEHMSGAEFDQAFAQEMSQGHDHMVSMLRHHQKQVSAPVRELVDGTLPVLEQHKDLADKVAKSVDRSGQNRARRPEPIKR
jgi:putative membrane protein